MCMHKMDSKICFVDRKWFFLAALSTATFTSSLCSSIQAPFYPQEAEKKGASPTEYGFVFGIFEFIGFLAGPIFAKFGGRVNPASMLNFGILVAGTSTILFGLLDWVNDHTWFVALSFILRITESLGTSAIFTSTLSLVAIVYFDTYARAFSVVEVLRGLAITLGPTLGGALYELGKFPLPFFVLGLGVIASGISIVIFLPRNLDDKVKKQVIGDLWPIIKIPTVFLDMFSLAVQAMSVAFIETRLEPHLREFKLLPSTLGVIYMIHSLVYFLLSPVMGVLCDRGCNLRISIILGCVATTVGIMFVGPMPYVPLNPSIWMVGVGMSMMGFGMALVFVPSMIDANYEAVKYSKQEDLTTYGTVSGMILSSFCLGAFTGPSISGVLTDAVGFRQGTLFLIAFNVLNIAMAIWLECTRRSYEELKETDSKRCTNAEDNSDDIALTQQQENTDQISEGPDEKGDPGVPILQESSIENYGCIEHTQIE